MHLCIVIFFVAIFGACAAQERTKNPAEFMFDVKTLKTLKADLEQERTLAALSVFMAQIANCKVIEDEDFALKCLDLQSQKEVNKAKHEALNNDIKIIDVLIRMAGEKYAGDSQGSGEPADGSGSGFYKLWEDVEDDEDDDDQIVAEVAGEHPVGAV